MTDFTAKRLLMKQLSRTPFWKSWEFMVEMEGFIEKGFPLYVRNVSLTPTELGTETRKLGADVLTYPVSAEPVVLSMTVRDDAGQTVSDWLNKQVEKTVNADGTWNPLSDYIFPFGIYFMDEGGKKGKLYGQWDVYVTQVGEIQFSTEEQAFIEIPVTLQQPKSLTGIIKNGGSE